MAFAAIIILTPTAGCDNGPGGVDATKEAAGGGTIKAPTSKVGAKKQVGPQLKSMEP